MTITSIIEPHVHILLGSQPRVRFFRSSVNRSLCGIPLEYAVITRSNGRVDRVQYQDRAEFTAHKAHITAKLVKAHKILGPIKGCSCSSCL